MAVYTIQPVVKRVWQQVVSCKWGLSSSSSSHSSSSSMTNDDKLMHHSKGVRVETETTFVHSEVIKLQQC